MFFPPTCEEAAVVLLHLLRRLKLLLGMFLREFVPQVQRVPLLSGETFHQQDLVTAVTKTHVISHFICPEASESSTLNIHLEIEKQVSNSKDQVMTIIRGQLE